MQTPNIDKLAQESYNFRNAISVCPVSTPYGASPLTGMYPTFAGMFFNDLHLPPTEYSILYYYRSDPNALVNLIDDQAHAEATERLKNRLYREMRRTGDPLHDEFEDKFLNN